MKLRSAYRELPPLEGEFSLRTRHSAWLQASQQTHPFDLVIIGGGIVGAGVALEASLHGLKVALVEKGDFASGTSSKSSKLLHGGLRYLEKYEFPLVFEALSARNSLFDLFPHLAHKIPFLMPIYREYGEQAWFINLGCWVYDLFSWLSSPFHTLLHRWVDSERLKDMEPTIRKNEFTGGVQFYDAYCDDARLVLETIKTAQAAGAQIFSYSEVSALPQSEGRVQGVTITDRLSGATLTLPAKRVINATGPWADHINHLADPSFPSMLRPTKGIHLIVPRLTQEQRAIMLKSVPDHAGIQRWMFIIPYGEYSIVGTTDTGNEADPTSDYLDTDNYATAADIDYLLASVNRVFPEADLKREQIVSSYGGWRPLVAPPGAVHESEISREHEILETVPGIVMIAGGKLTTYLTMAQDLLHFLHKKFPQEFKLQPSQPLQPLCNLLGSTSPEELIEQVVKRFPDLPQTQVAYLAQRYGTGTLFLLELCEQYLDEPFAAIQGLSPEAPLLAAEVAYAVCFEMALTVSDVLARRQRILLRDAAQGQKAVKEVATLMARLYGYLLDWPTAQQEAWIREQVKAYGEECARTNAWKQTPAGISQ